MGRIHRYQDEYDEYLHPFWLGLLILFTVVIVVGIGCLLRKKYGSRIRHLFNCLCCKKKLKKEHHPKTNGHLSMISPYNWAPTYIPPSSLSPKLYKLVRNFQMVGFDRESPMQQIEINEDSIENDPSSIIDEADYIKVYKLLPPINKNRTSEAARKFFASMRQTSQCQNSTSLDSYTNEPSIIPTKIKSNRPVKTKLFHTSHFFQSITNTHE